MNKTSTQKFNFSQSASFSLKTVIAIFALIFAFVLSILVGSQNLSLQQFAQAFTQKESFAHTIIFSLRLPRSILVAISGMLLAASGSAFQMYFRNSLAEPGIIGISAGATLGAVIAQSFGIATIAFGTISSVNVFAFLGAIIAGGIITLLSTRSSKDASVTLLLCGSALGLFYSSISSIILLTKTKELHGIYTWILGSFNGRSWQEVFIILVPSVVAIAILLFSSGKLDLMAGGETSAKALGLDTKKLKIVIIIAASLAVSASVCAGGTINFIGLIAPHIVRKIYGTKGKTLIPISMLYGAILLLLSDTIARTIIAPAELPAGLITSLLGVPFFISLIFSKQKRN